MSDRPSDGMELDELRDEYDWMYEFQSLMAERIRGDADVHNLVDYVCKLEDENAKLREELAKARDPQRIGGQADPSSFAYAIEQLREFRWQHATNDEDAIPYINNVAAAHERENATLRDLVREVWRSCPVDEDDCKRCPHYMGESDYWCDMPIRMETLGIEMGA